MPQSGTGRSPRTVCAWAFALGNGICARVLAKWAFDGDMAVMLRRFVRFSVISHLLVLQGAKILTGAGRTAYLAKAFPKHNAWRVSVVKLHGAFA